MFWTAVSGPPLISPSGFGHIFQPILGTASVPLASGGRLAKFGASNLETFLKVLEVCQIDVTEDFNPELRGRAATP